MKIPTISIFLILSMFCVAMIFDTASPEICDAADQEFTRVEVTLIKGGKNAGGKFTLGPGDYGRNLTVSGKKRYYEVHVPPGYTGKNSVPLVLVFHGGGSDQGIVRYESRMDATADRSNFIAVYPAGTNDRLLLKNRLLLWNDGRPNKDGKVRDVDDVQFVKDMLADIQSLFNVNTKKVYSCGYSNGAQFTYSLVGKIPGKIAAIAAIAGQRAPDDSSSLPDRPIPVMQFSGKLDTIAPYDGGAPHFEAAFQTNLKSVRETTSAWVVFNQCFNNPEMVEQGNAVMERFSSCENNTEVILWTLFNGGHTWPGGRVIPAAAKFNLGPINKDISASDLIWEFFDRYSLP